MDRISAEMYDQPVVDIVGFFENKEQITKVCGALFGRTLGGAEIAELIGAPSNSSVFISADSDINDLQLKIEYFWFGEPHSYTIRCEYRRLVVEIETVHHKDDAPKHLLTRILARQVRKFREYGIKEIQLFAEGYPSHPNDICGYYTWARLGFDIQLNGFGRRLTDAGFKPVDTTIELFNQPGGAEWWKLNGNEGLGYFDLEDDSLSIIMLEAYLKENGIEVDE